LPFSYWTTPIEEKIFNLSGSYLNCFVVDCVIKNTNNKSKIKHNLNLLDFLYKFLTILNNQPARYMPESEFRKIFSRSVRKFGYTDENEINNIFNTLLVDFQGLNAGLAPNDKTGIPDQKAPQNAEYLADVAEIRQTKFIDMLSLGKENGYSITPKGIEFLSSLNLQKSSLRLEKSTLRLIELTGLLAVFALASLFSFIYFQVHNINETITYSVWFLILSGFIVVSAYAIHLRRNEKK